MDNKQPDKGIEITDQLVVDCLNANAKGDGILYCAKHQGKIAINKSSSEPLVYNGHHWEIDVFDRHKDLVDEIAVLYLQTAQNFEDKKAAAEKEGNTQKANGLEGLIKRLNKRAERLRSVAGINATTEVAFNIHDDLSIAVSGDQVDAYPWLFGCKNGVIDLKLGELRKGKPTDWIVRSSPVAMPDIETPCPIWQKFLWDCLEDQALIDFLQRFFGYCLTGTTLENLFLILSGLGRNGKGVFLEAMLRIFGEMGKPIQAEMLLDQGRRNAAGPSPDVMDLQGLRLAVASESDEARRFSPSRIKWFTGSDTLAGRNPHDRRLTRFQPTHKLVLQTNNDPYAPADDFAFWNRTLKVDWPFSFVRTPKKSHEKPIDLDLSRKLQEEYPAILAWLVRGNILWQHEGLNVPLKVREAVQKYQMEQDLVQDWLDERCVVDQDPAASLMAVTAQDAYKDFSEWYKTYFSKKVPTISWFGRRMGRKFTREKSGVYRYIGVQLMSD